MLKEIQNRIQKTAQSVNRDPNSVRLIAVSKGQPASKMRTLIQAGQVDFGENYAQELLQKEEELKEENVVWHFIGHLQTNKAAKIAESIEWLHSLDSLKLAQAIHQKTKKPLKALLEINLGGEESKTGLDPTVALALIPELYLLSGIDLRGLMTLPPPSDKPEKSRPYFRELSRLLKEINSSYPRPNPLTELSMGMSDDFEVAIEEGATMVRIGTALFGMRTAK